LCETYRRREQGVVRKGVQPKQLNGSAKGKQKVKNVKRKQKVKNVARTVELPRNSRSASWKICVLQAKRCRSG